jgi:hypothetical protein
MNGDLVGRSIDDGERAAERAVVRHVSEEDFVERFHAKGGEWPILADAIKRVDLLRIVGLPRLGGVEAIEPRVRIAAEVHAIAQRRDAFGLRQIARCC